MYQLMDTFGNMPTNNRKERTMKRKITLCVSIVCSIIILLFTPAINAIANQSRNVDAIGGEGLLWLIPIIVATVVWEVGDIRNA